MHTREERFSEEQTGEAEAEITPTILGIIDETSFVKI